MVAGWHVGLQAGTYGCRLACAKKLAMSSSWCETAAPSMSTVSWAMLGSGVSMKPRKSAGTTCPTLDWMLELGLGLGFGLGATVGG